MLQTYGRPADRVLVIDDDVELCELLTQNVEPVDARHHDIDHDQDVFARERWFDTPAAYHCLVCCSLAGSLVYRSLVTSPRRWLLTTDHPSSLTQRRGRA
jgi:hypothetical protein